MSQRIQAMGILLEKSQEVERLRAMKSDGEAKKKSALAGDMDKPTDQKKFAEGQNLVMMATSRLPRAEKEEGEAREELRLALSSDISAWNTGVAATKIAKEEEIVRASLPLGGFQTERECRRWWDQEDRMATLPIFYDLGRAIFEPGDTLRTMEPDRAAQIFDAHVKRASKTLGIDPENLPTGPTRSKRDQERIGHVVKMNDPSHKVLVRAVSGVQFKAKSRRELKPGQAPTLGVCADDGTFIENGEQGTLTYRQYMAAARFLELLKDPA
jgi:hypothetical protein